MLIDFGNTIVFPNWEIDEKEATGYIRVYYIIGGEATYFSEGSQCELRKGHLYILPNTIPYQITRNKSLDLECTYLHIDIATVLITGIIDFRIIEESALYYYVRLLRKLIFENRVDLLEAISENVISFCKETGYCVSNSVILAKAKAYILNHLYEKILIEQLSELFHYNTNYFIDVFKKEADCTPYQYILRMRMQFALKYMKSGMKIAEVASKVGYTDVSTFRHAFSNYYGMAPGTCMEATKDCR